MPKCSKCSKTQNLLNKGALCKECFSNKINKSATYETKIDDNYEDTNNTIEDDRYVIDIMKSHMMREKELSTDFIEHFKEEIRYLKDELLHKNNLINKLMSELINCNNRLIYDIQENKIDSSNCNRNQAVETNMLSRSSSITSINTSLCKGSNQPNIINNNVFDNPNMQSANTFLDWQPIGSSWDNGLKECHQPFNANKEYHAQSIGFQPSRNEESCVNQSTKSRPNVVINEYPENDTRVFRPPKHTPGNSSYANMTKQGNKTAIITDSICSRINMKEFNKNLKNSYAYRKAFPGGKSEEIGHYCTHTILKDAPDSVILNVGTNDLNNMDCNTICDNIMNIVNTCHEHGVSKIYVSGVIYRKGLEGKVNILNNLLCSKQLVSGFTFIDNSNITSDHIWKDNIHLNNMGVGRISSNFIYALNCNNSS